MTRTAVRGRPATSTRQPAVCIRRTSYPRAVFKRFRAQAYNPGVSGVQEEMPSGRGKHTRAWLRRGFLPGPPPSPARAAGPAPHLHLRTPDASRGTAPAPRSLFRSRLRRGGSGRGGEARESRQFIFLSLGQINKNKT